MIELVVRGVAIVVLLSVPVLLALAVHNVYGPRR